VKAVEVAVREAAGLGARDIGKDLMRKAVEVNGGPLTDMEVEPAERQARSDLFAGAIGSYNNPHSHRNAALDDPDEGRRDHHAREPSPTDRRCARRSEAGYHESTPLMIGRVPRAGSSA
jgi:hypothetical protein